jgi:Arm domain-containing DNA-binding protein
MKYRLFGDEQTYSIGVYPDVDLEHARAAAREARKLIAAVGTVFIVHHFLRFHDLTCIAFNRFPAKSKSCRLVFCVFFWKQCKKT